MHQQDIFDVIHREASNILDVDPALITPDALLGDTLGADSVDLIEIAGVVEQTFTVQLEDHELHDLVTVGDFVELVARKTGRS